MTTHRVALVTGSGKKRVGSVVADALARCGYAIAVHYRSSAAEAEETVAALRAHGVEAEPFLADLASEEAVRGLVAVVLKRFGRIDVLVNCAAVWKSKRLEEVTAADVKLHFDTNALGTFLMCQHVGLQMTKQAEGGAIVNIGDWAEVRPYLNYAAYFPSKGAVSAITKTMAVELGTRNPKVRVNQISPGPVMLPPDLPEEEKRQAIDATLVKREGSPHNIAAAVLSLVENDFVTGVTLPVDGGRTVFAPGMTATNTPGAARTHNLPLRSSPVAGDNPSVSSTSHIPVGSLALGLPTDAIDPELIRLAAAWSRLPPPIRAAVVALVRTTMPSEGSVAGTGLDDSLPPGFEKLTPRE